MAMTEHKQEQISALMDDELPGRSGERLLDELKGDLALRRRWERYHLIGDAMKNNLPELLPHDLSARVSKALELEPAIVAPRPRGVPSLAKYAAGIAVAASVAVAVILAVQPAPPGDGGGAQQVAAAPAEDNWVRASGMRWDLDQPQVEQRLNNYLVNHNEHAVMMDMQGVLPYVRIVGYDSEQ